MAVILPPGGPPERVAANGHATRRGRGVLETGRTDRLSPGAGRVDISAPFLPATRAPGPGPAESAKSCGIEEKVFRSGRNPTRLLGKLGSRYEIRCDTSPPERKCRCECRVDRAGESQGAVDRCHGSHRGRTGPGVRQKNGRGRVLRGSPGGAADLAGPRRGGGSPALPPRRDRAQRRRSRDPHAHRSGHRQVGWRRFPRPRFRGAAGRRRRPADRLRPRRGRS